MELSVNVNITAPKKAVWQAITDIKNCQKMISAILKIEVLEQPSQGLIGLKWQETREMFGKEATETMWITEAEPERYYQTRAENGGAVYISRLAITEIDANHSTLTMCFSGTAQSLLGKIMSKLMGLLIKKSMVKMLKQDLNDIKSLSKTKAASSGLFLIFAALFLFFLPALLFLPLML